jgi:formiminoglutamate deiminase
MTRPAGSDHPAVRVGAAGGGAVGGGAVRGGAVGGGAVGGRLVRRWHAELALLPGDGVRADVLIEAEGDRFTAVTPGVGAGQLPAGVIWLPGLTMPGLANAHSHAFHRALRGLTQAGAGTFWTWRERMYEVAARLDPGSYLALATAVYAEMALAGITCVGEFHYLHHGPGGTRYADPNEMGRALLTAASLAGIRITLLDTCYLSGGLTADGRPQPLAGPQLRFGDGDAEAWAARADALGADSRGALSPMARVGAAIHSVRAVPVSQMHPVIAWSHQLGAPLHAHLSEQVAENEACLAAYRRTPSEVLYEAGALGPRSTMVHATHLTGRDLELIGGSRVYACLCPTTEADLADGIGPAGALAAAGSLLTVGSDSHAVIDLFDEARRVEQYERLATGQRGNFSAGALARAATLDGHASLGWPEAGEITAGALADLVSVSMDSVRLAGATSATALESVIFAATAADVRTVVASGRDVVREGGHVLLGNVPAALAAAVHAVTG